MFPATLILRCPNLIRLYYKNPQSFRHRFPQCSLPDFLLILQNVNARSLILIHPANDASKELQGCIAPVIQLTGIGKGVTSRIALEKLVCIYLKAREGDEKLTINIQSNRDEYNRQIQKTDTHIF